MSKEFIRLVQSIPSNIVVKQSLQFADYVYGMSENIFLRPDHPVKT